MKQKNSSLPMNHYKKEISWLLREKYSGVKTSEFSSDTKRLKKGEPVDYLIGNRPFLGSLIDLSYRPLIPREETEFWVKKALDEISHSQSTTQKREARILDLFSGSGCIGIALLKHLSFSSVDLAEVNRNCLEQIQYNLRTNDIPRDRYRVFHSDIFTGLDKKKKYDYIFANPPYISETNYRALDVSVRSFEPKQALQAGKDGLFFIQKLIDEAPEWLTENGTLFIEFDSPQKKAIQCLFEEKADLVGCFWEDQYEKPRVCVITKKNSAGDQMK